MKWGMVDLAKYQEDIQKRDDNYDFTLSGNQGHCFIEKDKIIKIYRDNITNRSDLSSLKSDRIAFPDNYISYNGVNIAEVMPYFDISSLDGALKDESSIEKLIFNYDEIKKEIEKFYYILMIDLCYLNILYNENKGIFLIDTTSWWLNKDIKSNFFYLQNMHNLDKSLFIILCHSILGHDFDQIMQDITNGYHGIKDKWLGKELLYLLKMNILGEEYKFKDLLLAYQEMIRINYNCEINTIGEMKKYAKLLKNS